MPDYLFGLDAGNTVIKAVLFDAADGRELAYAVRDSRASLPAPGYVERDLNELWVNTLAVIRECLDKSGVDSKDIRAIGCAGHGNGLYAVDIDGMPVLGIQSLDTRATQVVADWAKAGIGDKLHALCLQKPWVAQTPTLLAWVKQHQPERYAAIDTVLLCKDYVVGKLTGNWHSETTDMSGCGLLDASSRNYSAELLSIYGLGDAEAKMPKLMESADLAGTVTPEIAQATGLAEGTPVVAGLFDVVASALGSGVEITGAASIIAGSWSINQVVTDTPLRDPNVFMSSTFDRQRWLAIESSATSAANLEWLVHQFFGLGEGKPFHRASELVASVAANADLPIYHPFLYGAQQDGNARAGFYGIGGWHTEAHLVRALFEGVVFEHKRHLDVLRGAGAKIDSAVLSGGGSRSSIWPQIFSDTLNLPVTVAQSQETGALGAAIAAGTGVGIFADYAAGVAAMTAPARDYSPNVENGKHYQKRADLFAQLARAMAPIWAEMGRP
jgi:L-xylulokinase